MHTDTAGTQLRLGPQVQFTSLPFGGAVLVHAATLSITECSEHETHVIEQLLSYGAPETDAGSAGEAARRMAQELITAGWLELGSSGPHVPTGPLGQTIGGNLASQT